MMNPLLQSFTLIPYTVDEPGSSIGLYFRIFRTLLPFQISSIARTCYRHLLCTRTPSTNIYIISPVLRTLSSNFAALQQYLRTISDVLCPNAEDFTLLANVFTLFLVFALSVDFSVLRSLPTCSSDHRNPFRIIFDLFYTLSPIQIAFQYFAPLALWFPSSQLQFVRFRFALVLHTLHLCLLLFYIHFDSFRIVRSHFSVRTSHPTQSSCRGMDLLVLASYSLTLASNLFGTLCHTFYYSFEHFAPLSLRLQSL
jgi:hypothetical protein